MIIIFNFATLNRVFFLSVNIMYHNNYRDYILFCERFPIDNQTKS